MAVGMIVPLAPPAGASNAGLAAAVITGVITDQFYDLHLTGVYSAVDTAANSEAVCATSPTTQSLTIAWTLSSPPIGPLPAGTLFSVGHFNAGGRLNNLATPGPVPPNCIVDGTIGDGVLFGLSGASIASVGAVTLAEFRVNYTVQQNPLATGTNSGPLEMIAAMAVTPLFNGGLIVGAAVAA